MKYILILILFSVIYCMGTFSCKEKERKSYRELFQGDSLVLKAPEAESFESEFGFELNFEPDPNRGAWQNPELVIRKLGALSGKTIADVGSGTGYFTFPIARTAKKVVAIDIEQRYLDYIEQRKLELPIQLADRIETRFTEENEPNLHAEEVDAVLMVNVFYYLNNRVEYMQIVKEALRDGGLLVLVDFKPGDLPVGPVENKIPAGEVVKVLDAAGFHRINVDEESLKYQYIITAR